MFDLNDTQSQTYTIHQKMYEKCGFLDGNSTPQAKASQQCYLDFAKTDPQIQELIQSKAKELTQTFALE
jgi:hypothetical protein